MDSEENHVVEVDPEVWAETYGSILVPEPVVQSKRTKRSENTVRVSKDHIVKKTYVRRAYARRALASSDPLTSAQRALTSSDTLTFAQCVLTSVDPLTSASASAQCVLTSVDPSTSASASAQCELTSVDPLTSESAFAQCTLTRVDPVASGSPHAFSKVPTMSPELHNVKRVPVKVLLNVKTLAVQHNASPPCDAKTRRWTVIEKEGDRLVIHACLRMWKERKESMETFFCQMVKDGHFPPEEKLPWKEPGVNCLRCVNSLKVVYMQLYFLKFADLILWDMDKKRENCFFGITWFAVPYSNLSTFDKCMVPSGTMMTNRDKNPCKKTVDRIWKTCGFNIVKDYKLQALLFVFNASTRMNQTMQQSKHYKKTGKNNFTSASSYAALIATSEEGN